MTVLWHSVLTSNQAQQSLPGCLSIAVPPHTFIQIGWDHVIGCTDHVRETAFDCSPVRLHVVGAGSGCRATEVLAVRNPRHLTGQYACHLSDHMVLPGSTTRCIIGNSVAALRAVTSCMYSCFVSGSYRCQRPSAVGDDVLCCTLFSPWPTCISAQPCQQHWAWLEFTSVSTYKRPVSTTGTTGRHLCCCVFLQLPVTAQRLTHTITQCSAQSLVLIHSQVKFHLYWR